MSKTKKQCIYVDDKRGTYYYKIYYCDIYGIKHQTCRRGFVTLEEAERAMYDFVINHACDCTMPLAAIANAYFNYCKTEKDLRDSTLYTRRCIIDTHILPFFGSKAINKIHQRDVLAWHHHLKLDNSNFSDAYLYEISKTLILLFRFAKNFLDLNDNVAEKCGYIGHARTKHDNFWTEDDFTRFLQTLNNATLNNSNNIHRKVDNFLLVIGFKILFYMGLRIGELLGLTIADFNIVSKELTVNKQYHNNKFCKVKTQASNRTLPICDSVYTDLCTLRNMIDNANPNQRLFETLNSSNLRRALNSTAKITNLKSIRLHDLRHSCAALLFSKKATALEVQKYLGHAKIATTQDYYGHVYPEDLTNLANLLDK